MLRSSLAALAALSFAGAASATVFTAVAADAARAESDVVAAKAIWKCEEGVCTARLARKKATVRTCMRVVGEIGAVSSFGNANNMLTDTELAECNTSAK